MHLDDLSGREAELEATHDRASEGEGKRGPHRPLGPPRVRRRVDLLGRDVDDVGDPLDADLGRRQPVMAIAQPDDELGARPCEANRVESTLVELRRTVAKPVEMLVPRRNRIGLVEPGGGRDRLPQTLDIWLAEDRGRPARVRVADDRPLDQPPVIRVQELLGRKPRARPLGAPLVGVCEELGLRFSGDRDRRAAGLDQVVDECERARRASSRASPRARAGPVRAARACRGTGPRRSARRARRRGRPIARTSGRCSGSGVDAQELTRLKIDSHLYREARVPFEPLVRNSRVEPYSVCRVNALRRAARTSVVASSRCSSRRSPPGQNRGSSSSRSPSSPGRS